MPVIAVQVSRDEVDAGADVERLQGLHERIAIQPATLGINTQNEQMPRVMLGVAGQGKGQDRAGTQPLKVMIGEHLTPCIDGIQALQLHQCNAGVDVCQVVFEARFDDLAWGLRPSVRRS